MAAYDSVRYDTNKQEVAAGLYGEVVNWLHMVRVYYYTGCWCTAVVEDCNIAVD